MRQYGCLQGLVLSFYSRDFYRDVAKNWGSGVLLYLILLLVICWACLSISVQKTVSVGYKGFSETFFPQLPAITIKNGKVSTPENRPYLIKDSDNKLVAVVDTSGKYKDLESAHISFLVTDQALIYKSHKEERIHKFDSDFNLDLKPDAVKKITTIAINWLWVIFFPIVILASLIYRLIQSALYAILGELFAVICKVPLTYGQIFKLTIFAITPSIILSTILEWFSISFNHLWLLYFVLSMGYLFFAIKANK